MLAVELVDQVSVMICIHYWVATATTAAMGAYKSAQDVPPADALGTKRRAMTQVVFLEWARCRLSPRLRHGDIVLLDNLQAHEAPEVRCLIEARGATVKRLPPYPHDFSPIEPVWGLVKTRLRDHAPRAGPTLRRVAWAARHVVTPYHCRQHFAHTAYGHASGNRD